MAKQPDDMPAHMSAHMDEKALLDTFFDGNPPSSLQGVDAFSAAMLAQAVRDNTVDSNRLVCTVLKHYPFVAHVSAWGGITLLHEAAMIANVTAATALIEAGADINAVDKENKHRTALLRACLNVHYNKGGAPAYDRACEDMVYLLARNNADPTIVDFLGYRVDALDPSSLDTIGFLCEIALAPERLVEKRRAEQEQEAAQIYDGLSHPLSMSAPPLKLIIPNKIK